MHSKGALRRHLLTVTILLGIVNSVHLLSRPSALLKRSQLRRRLLDTSLIDSANGTLRLKRQLFREDIPHHRPLSGNTYYLHAGFPHPSRWHDGPQTIPPNPNPITHHHHQHRHRHNNQHNFHNDLHDHHHHGPPPQHHHHHHDNNGLIIPLNPIATPEGLPPQSVTIQSDIVHSSGVYGGVVDNSIVNMPHAPFEQANFDPVISHGSPSPVQPLFGSGHQSYGQQRPHKPHSEPEPFDGGFQGGNNNYHAPPVQYGGPPPLGPPQTADHDPPLIAPTRKPPIIVKKPKTIIHYHPVSVGNVINFNDDHKPVPQNPYSYGPPQHVPGPPLSHKDAFMSVAEPFIKTPFKSVGGAPEFFNQHKPQYGPPDHEPGPPLDALHLEPMRPSYGPPVKGPPLAPIAPHKPDPISPYSVALPVLAAHFGAPQHHHPPPKRYRGGRHRQHQHFHHFHHPPPPQHAAENPNFFEVKYPSYVVHGHVPKFPYHSPTFSSRTQLKSFWSL